MTTSSNMKHVIRGGQIVLHNFRMFNQIALRVGMISLCMFAAMNIILFLAKTSAYQRYCFLNWLWAHIHLLFSETATQVFREPNGESIRVFSRMILLNQPIDSVVRHVFNVVILNLITSGMGLCFSSTLLMFYLRRRGKSHLKSTRLSGDYLVPAKTLVKILKEQGSLSGLKLSTYNIPIPDNTIKQHFLFHGTTGSGKSTAIKEFLDQLRERGDPVFIYDKGCVLTEQFFCQDTDVLLNCLDERGANWDLWQECKEQPDFEAYATAQIPMPPGSQDPFWINAARTIFSAAAYRLKQVMDKPRLLPLLQYLLTAELSEITSLLQGTEAESLMSEKIEKTAISIKSVLATYLKSLCYVKEGENAFSIRRWVENPPAGQWVFLSSRGDKHETLKPLITAWIDTAINTLLSLPENPERRIWFILDELTSLHQLPKITDGLSEGRKFGGCFVIGIQNIAKLQALYGTSGAKNISALLNTRTMFRQPDPDVAQWSSRNLGEMVIEEVSENISYGANTMRDGVSIQRHEKRKPVVTSSDIMHLPDLSCYLRMPGKLPITKLDFKYKARSKKTSAFIARELPDNRLRDEVASLITKVKQSNALSGSTRKTKKKTKTNEPQATLFDDYFLEG